MIVLYTLLLFTLGAIKFLIARRAAGLESKYARAADAANTLMREPLPRPGQKTPDAYQAAKRQYLLGLLVQKRDRFENRHDAWQQRSEKLGKLIARLRAWKGKKLPYTMGVLDVSCLMYLADYLGVGHYVSLKYLIQQVSTLMTN